MCRRINAQSCPNETRGLKTIFSKAMTRMPSWMSSVSDSAAIPHSSQMAASASWWPQGSAPPSSSHRDPGPYQKTEPRAGLEARGVPERPQCTCDPQGSGGEAAFQLVQRGAAENPCETFLSAASLDHQVSSRRSCRSIGRSLLAAPYLKLRPDNPLATPAAVTFLPCRDQP